MQQSFLVPEIHCASCVMLLEELEDECESVRSVKVNLAKRTAEVDFDEDQMSTEEVLEEIQKISGYKAVLNV